MLTQIRLSLDSQIIAARPRDGCRTTYRKGDRIEKYNRLTLLFVLSRGLHHRLTLLKTAPMSDTFWDTFWDTFENTLFWHFVWHCFLHSFWHSQNRPASGRHFFKTSLSNVCNAFFTFVGSPPSARTIPPSPKRHFFRHLGLNPFLDTFFNTLFCHFLLSLFLDTLFRHMLVHTSFYTFVNNATFCVLGVVPLGVVSIFECPLPALFHWTYPLILWWAVPVCSCMSVAGGYVGVGVGMCFPVDRTAWHPCCLPKHPMLYPCHHPAAQQMFDICSIWTR